MVRSFFSSLRTLLLPMMLMLAGRAWADYTTTLVEFTTGSDLVIDADALGATPPGRSVIPATVTLSYLRNPAVDAGTQTFTLNWSLIGPDDGVAASGTSTQPVSWSDNPFPRAEAERTTSISLDPTLPLDSTKRYRLRVVATPAAGGVATTHTQATGTYFNHFTNTTSEDVPLNVKGRLVNPGINQEWMITENAEAWPRLSATALLARYDGFDHPSANATFPLRLRVTLVDVAAPGVTVMDATELLNVGMASHAGGGNPITSAPVISLLLQPQNLNRSAMYQATAVLDYQDADGSYVPLGTEVLPAQRIFPVTGVIWFGDVEARFTELAAVPTQNGTNWNLTIPAGKGFILGKTGHTFGGSFVVSLNAAGDATVITGTTAVTTATADIETVANVRIKRENLTLSPAGASAKVSVYLPAGFMISAAASNSDGPPKNAAGKAVFESLALAGKELTLPNPLALTPSAIRLGMGMGATTATQVFANHERLPAWFRASNVMWNRSGSPQTSSFAITAASFDAWRWVREAEMAQVDTVNAVITNAAWKDSRASNERLLRNAAGAYPLEPRSFSIAVNAQGVAVVNARLPFGSGQAEPHYPQGTGVSAAAPGFAFASGVLEIVNDAVNPATSGVFGVTQIVQRHARGGVKCPQGSAAQTGSFVFQPSGQTLRFTDELGLIAEGSLTTGELKWGVVDAAGTKFAQRVKQSFTEGVFYQPGFVLPGSVAAGFSENHRAGVLLLSGREKPGGTPADLAYVERPNSTAYYTAGLANYAGLNLRTAPGMEGVSLMDDAPVEYPLKPNGKYHVQLGGVTGRHQRMSGGAALNVTFYDFPVQLTEHKLSFLDNWPQKSFTAGSLDVPFPVGITQTFSELLFNDKGQPISARMPAGPQTKYLAHWSNVPFVAQSLAFHPQKGGDACSSLPQKKGFIEMGAVFTNLGGIIPGNVTAALGFKSVGGRGELITLEDSKPNKVAVGTQIDSRLHLPPNLRIVVPNGGEYRLNPVTKGCFSDSNGATVGSPSGFLSFAGMLAVPFFKEMPVHAHLELATVTPRIHFMGGWPEGGKTFFTDPGSFDPLHRGSPGNITLADYRASTGSANDDIYRTRAQKCWMDVVDFDFPLKWDATTRRFASVQEKTTDLLIFDIKHQLRALSGSGAEISFGAELPGLPQFNLQRMVMDELDDFTGGHFQKFSTALANTAVQGVNATGITKAVTAIDKVITDRVDAVFEASLGGAVDALLAQAFGTAEAQAQILAQQGAGLEAQKHAYLTTLKNQLGSVQNTVEDAIGNVGANQKGLMKFLAGTSSAQNEAQGQLRDVLKGIQDLRLIIARDPVPNGPRRVFRELTANLADLEGLDDEFVVNELNYLGKALDNLEEVQEFTNNPFFGDLDKVLEAAENELSQALALADSRLGAPLKSLSSTVLTAPGFLSALDSRINAVIAAQLPPLDSTLRDVTGANQLRLALRRAILDQVQATALGDRIQGLLRDNFGPLRDVVRDSLDKITAQITTTVKEAFHAQISDGLNVAGNPLNGLVDEKLPLKQFSEVFQGSNLRGYARTVGNSISTLRLDGGIKFSPPGMGTGMEFAGYFEYEDRKLKSTPPEEGCLNPAGTVEKACVVSAGASFGSKARAGKTAGGAAGTAVLDDMNVGLNVQFAFKAGGPLGVVPLGFTGNQNFRGKIELGIITIEELDMKVNFSNANQYLLAYANGKIVKILGAKVWILAGHVCNLSTLKVRTAPGEPDELLLDPYTAHTLANVLKKAPTDVFGVLAKTVGEISLNDLLRDLSQVDLPKDVLEVSFKRGYTYFGGVSVAPNQIDLLAAMAMYGRMQAKFLGRTVTGVEAGIAGSAKVGLLNWLNDFPAVTIGVTGGANFEAMAGLLEADLKVTGKLSRDGLSFEKPTVKILDLPIPPLPIP